MLPAISDVGLPHRISETNLFFFLLLQYNHNTPPHTLTQCVGIGVWKMRCREGASFFFHPKNIPINKAGASQHKITRRHPCPVEGTILPTRWASSRMLDEAPPQRPRNLRSHSSLLPCRGCCMCGGRGWGGCGRTRTPGDRGRQSNVAVRPLARVQTRIQSMPPWIGPVSAEGASERGGREGREVKQTLSTSVRNGEPTL